VNVCSNGRQQITIKALLRWKVVREREREEKEEKNENKTERRTERRTPK
jgi:hypothetical protein